MRALNQWQFTLPPSGSPFWSHLPLLLPPCSAFTPPEKHKAPKGEQVNVLAVWDTLVTFQSGICFYRSWFKKCGGNGGMRGGMERRGRRRREPMGWCSYQETVDCVWGPPGAVDLQLNIHLYIEAYGHVAPKWWAAELLEQGQTAAVQQQRKSI